MLASHQGSRAALARQLGISERSLYRKLRELQGPRTDGAQEG
jgi:DNA-binding NtrC family response regulator